MVAGSFSKKVHPPSSNGLPPLVEAWRQSNPHIVMLWWDVDHAAMEAVKYHSTVKTHGILFSYSCSS